MWGSSPRMARLRRGNRVWLICVTVLRVESADSRSSAARAFASASRSILIGVQHGGGGAVLGVCQRSYSTERGKRLLR